MVEVPRSNVAISYTVYEAASRNFNKNIEQQAMTGWALPSKEYNQGKLYRALGEVSQGPRAGKWGVSPSVSVSKNQPN